MQIFTQNACTGSILDDKRNNYTYTIRGSNITYTFSDNSQDTAQVNKKENEIVNSLGTCRKTTGNKTIMQ